MKAEVSEEYGLLTQLEPDEDSEMKLTVLSMVAEGNPFIFLTLEKGQDEDLGEYLAVGISADMPLDIINATLAVAQEKIEAKLNSDK